MRITCFFYVSWEGKQRNDTGFRNIFLPYRHCNNEGSKCLWSRFIQAGIWNTLKISCVRDRRTWTLRKLRCYSVVVHLWLLGSVHGLLEARIMHLWYFQPKRWPVLSVRTGMTVPRADSNWNISSVSVPVLHYHIAGACKLSIFFLLSKILLFDCWAVTFSAASPVSRGVQRLELIFSINSNGCWEKCLQLCQGKRKMSQQKIGWVTRHQNKLMGVFTCFIYPKSESC